MKTIILLQLVLAIACATAASGAVITAGKAELNLDAAARAQALNFTGDPAAGGTDHQTFCFLESPTGEIHPTSTHITEGSLYVAFEDDSTAVFAVEPEDNFTLFRLTALDLKTSCTGMRLFRLPIPHFAEVAGTLNGYYHDDRAVALMSGSPEVLASTSRSGITSQNLPGCSHTLTQTTESKSGSFAAKFSSRNSTQDNGWSMRGRRLDNKLPREPFAGITAWVHGDGLGEQLKFQFMDDGGNARDYYLPIDFTGWRKVELTRPALDLLKEGSIHTLNLYYNSLPKQSDVVCLIDDIQALVVENNTTRTVTIEDFEDKNSSWWSTANSTLNLEMDFKYSGEGTTFGIIASNAADFFTAIEEFEKAANILTPYPHGTWNKKSAVARENYLFLTSFKQSQFDDALALAKRGGFKRILLGQESWCQSAGRYEVKKANFPDGLPGLARTMNRFREHGIEVGLHLLGASIDWNDTYLTPKLDSRLVTDASTTLTAPVDASTTTIVVDAMPENFPAEDGGYNGDGTVLWINDELIKYTSRTITAPYTFSGCVRGHLGTTASAHLIGAPVRHLARSYGYHMFDMDTTLLDEVTNNFARVANACNIDMVYFDGSERLQGDHRRYNARLINTYLHKLHRKDILVQASSYSHFSWHQLARTASADGHGDLKGYLEQRSPAFDQYKKIGMPLDIGWYYGYDIQATPDMYEYILGTTIGYDSAFSFQSSVPASKQHPFIGRILDLTKKYEELRMSGAVSEDMRERLRVPNGLRGKAPEEESRPTHLRRDYHLTEVDGKEVFQRVIYGQWQTADDPTEELQWQIEVTTGPAVVGVEIQTLKDTSPQAANTTDTKTANAPSVEVAGTRFHWDGKLHPGQYLMMEPGKKIAVYGPPLTEPHHLGTTTPHLTLDAGTHTVKFRCAEESTSPVRVRVNLQTPERWPLMVD